MIFGLPVYISSIYMPPQDKKEIIDTIEKNYEINKNRNKWDSKSLLHHMNKDYDNEDFHNPNYEKVIPLYRKEIDKFMATQKFKHNIKYDASIVNYTCMTSNQHMNSHRHLENDYTAVHYIKFNPEKHKGTVYENGNNYAEYLPQIRPEFMEMLDENNIENSWALQDWCYDIKEDNFVITPAMLSHHVPVQKFDEKRITIVMNIKVNDARGI